MAKSLGTRSGRTTPAQARKAARRREREGVVFKQSSEGLTELWRDGRLLEHDVPYEVDAMLDALRRQRISPRGTVVNVESLDGSRGPWRFR